MMEPKLVVRTMRKIKKDQVTDFVSRDVKNFIFEHELMEVTLWPAFCISITDRGINYLLDNSEESD